MKEEYKASIYMLPFLTPEEMRDKKNSYVYFMFSENSDILLYVGQTKNIKHRIQVHNANLEEMAMLLDDDSLRYVRYKAIAVDTCDLNEVEKHYIQRYCPPRNVAHNSRSAIRAYELWYHEKLLMAYNKNRAMQGEPPLTFEEAYGDKMRHTA
jgi:hypothetical protein